MFEGLISGLAGRLNQLTSLTESANLTPLNWVDRHWDLTQFLVSSTWLEPLQF